MQLPFPDITHPGINKRGAPMRRRAVVVLTPAGNSLQSSTLLLDSENPQWEGSSVAKCTPCTCFNFSTTHGICRNLICQGHFCLHYYFSCPVLQERQPPLNLLNSYFYTTILRTKHGANPQQWYVLTISLIFSKFRWV